MNPLLILGLIGGGVLAISILGKKKSSSSGPSADGWELAETYKGLRIYVRSDYDATNNRVWTFKVEHGDESGNFYERTEAIDRAKSEIDAGEYADMGD